MQYSENYGMKLPEIADQYNVSHMNDNTAQIDSLFHSLITKNVNDNTSLFYQMMLLSHPVGEIYWTNNSANPSTYFGGTWVAIKDRFVWAKGDSDVLNATGGAKTHKLVASEMPSHTHTIAHTHTYSHTHGYTPSGTNANTQPTFTGTAHTHTFTGSSATTTSQSDSTTANQSTSTTGGMSANSSGTFSFHSAGDESASGIFSVSRTQSGVISGGGGGFVLSFKTNIAHTHSYAHTHTYTHTHTLTATGTNANTTATGTNANTTATGTVSSHSHTFTGTASNTTSQSTTITSDSSNANSGSTGGGGAHNNMPPYIVKYCWERTA